MRDAPAVSIESSKYRASPRRFFARRAMRTYTRCLVTVI